MNLRPRIAEYFARALAAEAARDKSELRQLAKEMTSAMERANDRLDVEWDDALHAQTIDLEVIAELVGEKL